MSAIVAGDIVVCCWYCSLVLTKHGKVVRDVKIVCVRCQ